MKIRHGFVSNSSSSSFIVAFEQRPRTLHDLQGVLFDEDQTHYCSSCYEDSWGVASIAEAVNVQFRKQEPLDLDGVIEVVCSGYIHHIHRILEREFPYRYDPNETHEERRVYLEKREARERELAHEFITDWMLKPEVRGKELYVFEFSDGDGPMNRAMEHGDLFKNLPHIHVSHH